MDRTLSYLGFARKAGALAAGGDTCLMHIKKGTCRLLLVTCDTGPSAAEKVIRAAKNKGIPWYTYGTSETVGHATGLPGRHMYAITDPQFAGTIERSLAEAQAETKESNEEVAE